MRNIRKSMDDKVSRPSGEEEQKADKNDTHERSIIIVGSKGAGKTTMVYRFLEKEETPKPTIALDYSFGRKAGKSLVKNIAHIWEVGHLASSLVESAMMGASLTHSPHHTTLLVMIDLSRPEKLWSSLEETLSVIRSSFKMAFDDKTIEELNARKLKERMKELETGVDPFPMKICIVGGKYDEFKEFQSDKKQLVGQVLRAVAHSLGAGLHYHSSKDKVLSRRTRDLLSHYSFGAQFPEGKITDFEKPLFIPAGSDSFPSIDFQLPQMQPSNILDSIKQIYIDRIPQILQTDEITLEDPSNDPNFSEPIIDRLRTQREEVISVLLHDMLEGRMPQIPIPDPY
ncbi:hypothetical protein KM043_005381 [Ampulex compressa]|nr:hypothetical protein KM043_005381 [Ampulex compressa]